ncbi:PREDICTED: lamin tail domain-containing protein 2 isoform X4 [Chinchilla lanigera]|uniref:lamin tail domain-containing protein 2 isoform X4 n=1 Tax=Chinchilla lanigera TaxID=34839 RepID=UPI00038EA8E9|nr:PREDICTED: lamin tail domain-containing protein 2 isoform X4 [Chinchilla lanigera]
MARASSFTTTPIGCLLPPRPIGLPLRGAQVWAGPVSGAGPEKAALRPETGRKSGYSCGPRAAGCYSMAPEPGQASEEEQVLLALAGEEPAGNDSRPPATIPTDTMASLCSGNTWPPSTGADPSSTQLGPEALDPCTLRLLWEQRELEIQALRWAVRHGQHARHQYILQEVAGLPPERSSHSQDAFLQNQVQKLTLELRAQKEQAQLERERLEAQLAQTTDKLQQLEAELQAFQKSCLLHLAQSSWVGRILRSQTGSVEAPRQPENLLAYCPTHPTQIAGKVITAETLIESGDSSEDSQEPTAGEGFRLEDVDWNSIAQRYPNLLSSIHSSLDRKQPQLPSELDSPGSDSPRKFVERQHKSLEWSTLPCAGTSSSGGADLDSSSCQLFLHPRVQRVIGHPPPAADTASCEQRAVLAKRFSRDSEDIQRSGSYPFGQTSPEPLADLCHPGTGHTASPPGSILQIVAVSRREKFVRILNRSSQDTADLGGLVLQQRVWGEGTGGVQQHQPFSSGQDPLQFHCGRGCVTLLLDTEGQVLSEYQAPLRVTSGSSVFADNTDWSIDRFPLPEAGAGADAGEPQRRPRPPSQGRVQETRAGRRRRGTRRLRPLLSPQKPVHPREEPTRLEGAKPPTMPDPLPAIPETARDLERGVPGRERRVCVSARPDPSPGSPHPPAVPRASALRAWLPHAGVSEGRGPGLPHGGAVGAEHGGEPVRLPLPLLPAHNRGCAPVPAAGVDHPGIRLHHLLTNVVRKVNRILHPRVEMIHLVAGAPAPRGGTAPCPCVGSPTYPPGWEARWD